MKHLGTFVLAAALCFGPPAATAVTGTLDDVPGATLLLPYFEVDLEDANGSTTVISLHNATPSTVFAHVTLWTDWAMPTIFFDVELSGMDVEVVDLRDVFEGHYPPSSESECPAAQPLSEEQVELIRSAHRGLPSTRFNGQCGGQFFGDGVARGYATVDAVDSCAATVAGVSFESNALWGDWMLIERGAGRSAGEQLVSFEAVPAPFATTPSGANTSGGNQLDQIPTRWGGRYLGSDTGRTDLILWRDSIVTIEPVDCGEAPDELYPPFEITVFDDAENPFDASAFNPFPLATNRVTVGSPDLPTPFDNGWIFLLLDPLSTATMQGVFAPESGHLTVLRRSPSGDSLDALRGIPIDNVSDFLE